jgi:hypothetical protein
MKILALILSIYVIALTAMPCLDNHATEINSFSIEITNQNQYQTNDVDLCSPFCFCNCCQNLSLPTIVKNLQFNIVSIDLSRLFVEQSYPNPTKSFWQPPKI